MSRGPYMNEDGDWWVAVEDAGFREARREVVGCIDYEVPDDGTLRYVGRERVSLCEAPAGEHVDLLTGGVDPAQCDDTCRRDVEAWHFTENRRW